MQTFITDKEFEQAALNLIARLVCDYAGEYISTGNVADIGEQTLDYLLEIANANNLDKTIVATYHDIIATENNEVRDFYEDNRF